MNTTAACKPLPTEVRPFRPRRYYLVVGVVCALFFSGMGVVSTGAAYWDIDGSFAQPQRAALLFGLFWSGFTLLAIWILMAYFRERLFWTSNTIVQHGVIRSRTLRLEDVIHIIWRAWPVGGSIVIRTHSEKVTIYLDNFTKEERDELVGYFRETFAHEIQDAWSDFEDRLRSLSSPTRHTSRSGLLLFTSVFLCFASLFVGRWFVDLGGEYLYLGGINAIAALWCLWCARRSNHHLPMAQTASQDRPQS